MLARWWSLLSSWFWDSLVFTASAHNLQSHHLCDTSHGGLQIIENNNKKNTIPLVFLALILYLDVSIEKIVKIVKYEWGKII